MTDGRQSQVVLGQSGAEQLLGKGDLLFQDVGEPKRLQAPYLPEDERKADFRGSVDTRIGLCGHSYYSWP